MVNNVEDLIATANDAATAANNAATQADSAAAVADANPTAENLATVEDAQSAAIEAATVATNAANTLEAAINTLQTAADAANETIDISSAQNALTAANEASTTATAAATNSEVTTDAIIGTLQENVNKLVSILNDAVQMAEDATENAKEKVAIADEHTSVENDTLAHDALNTVTQAANKVDESIENLQNAISELENGAKAVNENIDITVMDNIIENAENVLTNAISASELTYTNDNPEIIQTETISREENDLEGFNGYGDTWSGNVYSIITQEEMLAHLNIQDSDSSNFTVSLAHTDGGNNYFKAPSATDASFSNTTANNYDETVVQITQEFLDLYPQIDAKVGDFYFDNVEFDKLGEGEVANISFDVVVSDGESISEPKTVNIEIVGSNDAPVIEVTATDTILEDSVAIGTVIGTVEASDIDGDNVDLVLSDTEHYTLTDNNEVVLTQVGADLVNRGEDLPDYTVTAYETQNAEHKMVLTDNTNSNITITDSDTLNLNGKENFELDIAVTPEGMQGNYDIIFNKENSVELAFTNDGHLQFAMRTDDESWTWHRTDVEYHPDEVNNISFKYDGENVTITNITADGAEHSYTQPYTGAIIDYGNDLMIGNRPYGHGRYSMDGEVDDVSVKVDGQELAKFDFQGSDPLQDLSGNGNDASLGEGAELETIYVNEGVSIDVNPVDTIDVNDAPELMDDRGNDTIILTDNTNSNITITDSDTLNLNGKENFELDIAVTPEGMQGNYDIIFNKENSVELAFTNDGHLQFAMRTDDESWTWHRTDVEYHPDEVNNISFKYDGENVTITNITADGAEHSYTQPYTGAIIDYGNDLMIGNRPYGHGRYSMDGEVDDVSVKVDGQELAKFDFQGSDPLQDLSGNGNDASLGEGASLHRGENITTDEDSSVTIDVLANDSDEDGDSLSIMAIEGQDVTNGQSATINDENGNNLGTATVDSNGKVVFTPSAYLQQMNDGESQDVTFNYTVSDSHGGQSSADATVTVLGHSDFPEPVFSQTYDNESNAIKLFTADMNSFKENFDRHEDDGSIVLTKTDTDSSGVFDFGVENAGKTVSISFDATSLGTWDNGGSYDDDFLFNGEELILPRGEQQSFTFESTVDENGQIKVDFGSKITGSDEGVSIENFEINASGTGWSETLQEQSDNYEKGSENIDTGSGDDTIVFDLHDTIDGGAGLDKLVATEDMHIDFSNLSDNISNIERIDLANGDQEITSLKVEDVLDMTDEDNILRIDGNEEDTIALDTTKDGSGEWKLGDFQVTHTDTGATYDVYTNEDNTVTLEVNTDIQVDQN